MAELLLSWRLDEYYAKQTVGCLVQPTHARINNGVLANILNREKKKLISDFCICLSIKINNLF